LQAHPTAQINYASQYGDARAVCKVLSISQRILAFIVVVHFNSSEGCLY